MPNELQFCCIMQGLLGQRGVDWMRDEEYCEIMMEAYRDIVHHILLGYEMPALHDYIIKQIKFHHNWMERIDE